MLSALVCGMGNFDNSQHPRSGDGRFAVKGYAETPQGVNALIWSAEVDGDRALQAATDAGVTASNDESQSWVREVQSLQDQFRADWPGASADDVASEAVFVADSSHRSAILRGLALSDDLQSEVPEGQDEYEAGSNKLLVAARAIAERLERG